MLSRVKENHPYLHHPETIRVHILINLFTNFQYTDKCVDQALICLFAFS